MVLGYFLPFYIPSNIEFLDVRCASASSIITDWFLINFLKLCYLCLAFIHEHYLISKVHIQVKVLYVKYKGDKGKGYGGGNAYMVYNITF